MTLDEAIKHCLEVAEHNEYLHKRGYAGGCNRHDCLERAIIHRQLAEWLMDYKGLRAEIIDLRLYVQMLEEYREKAKRLLKAAVEGMRWLNENTQDSDGSCAIRTEHGCSGCPLDINGDLFCKWKHEDEALALIGEDGEQNV